MPQIVYKTFDGETRTVDGDIGESVMEVAIKNDVPGIDADCGGACSCATCHVIVDATYWDRVGPPNDTEAAMLDFAENVTETSRLGCQIEITAELDGLTVQTPESQS